MKICNLSTGFLRGSYTSKSASLYLMLPICAALSFMSFMPLQQLATLALNQLSPEFLPPSLGLVSTQTRDISFNTVVCANTISICQRKRKGYYRLYLHQTKSGKSLQWTLLLIYLNLLVIRPSGLYVTGSPNLHISLLSQVSTQHQTWLTVSQSKFVVSMVFPSPSSPTETLCSSVPSGKNSFAFRAQH